MAYYLYNHYSKYYTYKFYFLFGNYKEDNRFFETIWFNLITDFSKTLTNLRMHAIIEVQEKYKSH